MMKMGKIEQSKVYSGSDLETTFFRPMLIGDTAEELGIRVLYNMPVPTVLNFWERSGDILHKFEESGWKGSKPSMKRQKTIDLCRVKAEMGYKAEDYFNMIYEEISGRADVNMGDLSGTVLEDAETTLFKESLAESIRATMWVGDTERAGGVFNTFDGLLKKIKAGAESGEIRSIEYDSVEELGAGMILKNMWDSSKPLLRDIKSQGNLVFLTSADVCDGYENELNEVLVDSAYTASQEGRTELLFRGIPVVELKIDRYLSECDEFRSSFAILTDRRNLALAVNTADFPGTEINMWYNPDQMENRQRAVFMAGCDYLMSDLITVGRISI